VRRRSRVRENTFAQGDPLATIEDALVPIYMLHRYQWKRRANSWAGWIMCFALRAMGRRRRKLWRGRAAARAAAVTGDGDEPQALALPEPLLENDSATSPPEFERGREHFKIRTSRHLTHWLRPKRRRNTRCNSCSIRCERRGLWNFMRGTRRTQVWKRYWML